MAPRFTERKNGQRMATARFAVHVPEAVVEQIAEATGCSKQAAFDALLREFESQVWEVLAYRYLKTEKRMQSRVVDGRQEGVILDERELMTAHAEDLDEIRDERPNQFEPRLIEIDGEPVSLDNACLLRRA